MTLDLATEAASRRLLPERLIAKLVSEPSARALFDCAADAEMLVLGTTRPGRQPGQPTLAMGPVARTCLRLAHCPVVVAPDGPPAGQGAGRRRGTMARSGEQPSALSPACPCRSGRDVPGLRGFLARFRLTVLRLGRQQPCLAGFPAARSPSRLPTSITPTASQISFGATGISSRFCGPPVSTTTRLRTIPSRRPGRRAAGRRAAC